MSTTTTTTTTPNRQRTQDDDDVDDVDGQKEIFFLLYLCEIIHVSYWYATSIDGNGTHTYKVKGKNDDFKQ